MAYAMLAGQLTARVTAAAGALAGWGSETWWSLPDAQRADFDAALASKPGPESETERLRREWGI